MKKLSFYALAIVVLVIGTFNVSALTEQGLKDKILQTITVGGEKYTLPSDKKKIAEDYFEKNEISDEDATYIGERVDKAISIIKAQGNVNFKGYSQDVKDELKGLVTEISKNTKVKATLTKEGLHVQNSDGSEIVITELVKQTGYESSKTTMIIALSFLIVAVGTGLVIKQVKTSE